MGEVTFKQYLNVHHPVDKIKNIYKVGNKKEFVDIVYKPTGRQWCTLTGDGKDAMKTNFENKEWKWRYSRSSPKPRFWKRRNF